MLNFKELKEIKGDASFRKFYRNKKNHSIVVYAKKEKVKNLLNYDAINKILLKNKILAPVLLSKNYKKNFIEIQDFGNQTIFDIFKTRKINKIKIYKQIIDLLKNLQSIKQKKITNFNNREYIIPIYTAKILENEAKLFSEWYSKKKNKKIRAKKI